MDKIIGIQWFYGFVRKVHVFPVFFVSAAAGTEVFPAPGRDGGGPPTGGGRRTALPCCNEPPFSFRNIENKTAVHGQKKRCFGAKTAAGLGPAPYLRKTGVAVIGARVS